MLMLTLQRMSSAGFGGLQRLYGLNGAQQIRASHVVVVGIGGVGSWAAERPWPCGVGRLTLIDMDHIAPSNINRQISRAYAHHWRARCWPCKSALPAFIQAAKLLRLMIL